MPTHRHRRPRLRKGRAWSVAPTLLLLGWGTASLSPVGGGSRGAPAPSTWSDGVASLLYGNCVSCHRPGGSAPFSLLTYAEAASRADKIAVATGRRRMPPWLPDPDVGEFAGERRLSRDQIELLRQWAEAGAPRGDSAAAPAPPVFSSEWALGEPDLIVEFPRFTVPAEGHDLYQNLVARASGAEARWVRALDLRPENNRVVHHARMMVDITSSSRELAEEDAGTGMEVMHISGQARNPDGFFIGWTPGKVAYGGRKDLAWRLEPGTDLALQVHLRPTGEPETIAPRAGLYFAEAPPTQAPALVLLRDVDIDIPPGDTGFVAEDSYRLPIEVDVLSVYPHAHYVGKRLEAWATLPNGRRRDLIRISDWNFNWQDEYRYAKPLRLPAGSIVTMHYTFDNSAANPRNPFDPPRRIVYGLQSTDEMAELILQVLPSDPAELGTLTEDLQRFSYQKGLREQAVDARSKAQALEREGRLEEALALYRESLRTMNDAGVMAAMAAIVLRQGDAASAVVVAEQAAALSRGTDPRILGTLARAYAGAGRTKDALDVVTRAEGLATARGMSALADSLATLKRSLGGSSP